MSELVVEPFTNEFGQVINPGDEVIFISTSYKQTNIRKGVFAGVRYDTVLLSREVKDADGNTVMETNKFGYERKKRETYTERRPVAVRVDKVNRGRVWQYVVNPETGKREYKQSAEDHFGVSTLPLKRIYKFDTHLSTLSGQIL